MFKKIARPINPYAKAWVLYNAQNPNLHRSVGADGDNDDTPTVESLQAQMKKDAATHATTVTQLETLTSDLDSFKEKHAASEKHKKEQEKAAKEALEEAARKSGDVIALEKSWSDKFNALEESTNVSTAGLNKIINNITVGSEARSIATELAMTGSAEVIQPIIQQRLYMEMVDGNPVVKVSKDGKPSAMTLADLKIEIGENKAFAPILKGSSANGNGSAGDGSGNPTGENVVNRAAFDKMSPIQQAHHMKKKGAQVVD